jgi:hypothetical protein
MKRSAGPFRSPFMGLSLAVLSLLSSTRPVAAQDQVPTTIRVFVNCSGDACDEAHLQREIAYVEWVRDQADADVEVLVAREQTGAGGERYELEFIGRRTFSALNDVLRYTRNPTDTAGEARDGLTTTLAAGLLRYVARTASLSLVAITYDDQVKQAGLPPVNDPWRRWVFRTSLGGTVTAEDRSEDLSYRASQSFSRVTEEMKFGLDVSGRYNESKFETSDTTTVTSVTETYLARLLFVRSLGSHWGLGFRGTAERSTYRNFDLALRLAPALEFNVFPYEESTRRQLRILYAVGPQYLRYEEETIFLRTEETRLHQSLTVSLDVQESWGSAIVAMEGAHFIDMPEQNKVEGYGFLQVRLVRGVGVFLEGSLARVRDQINLPRGDATPEEVLLRQRELETGFRLEGRIGVDLTFGSVYSNVVNARFGS